MSRAQQGQVFATGQGENKAYNTLATTSYPAAQQDISQYGTDVAKFKAANPYVTGGAAETAENQQIAGAAGGQAQRLNEALQSSAVRGGTNPNAAIAAGEKVTEENQRALTSEEAAATQQRLGAGTAYEEAGLTGNENLAKMQAALAGQESGAGQAALGTEEQAAQTPSFLDELGTGFINAGDQFAAGYGRGKAGP